MQLMSNIITWKGKVFFTSDHLTESQYSKFFDTDAITYALAEATMRVTKGSPHALPVDFCNVITRKEMINKIAYGSRWMSNAFFRDIPDYDEQIECCVDGAVKDFYDLPFAVRKQIAKNIIDDCKENGSVEAELN